jgi:hypothetical protein
MSIGRRLLFLGVDSLGAGRKHTPPAVKTQGHDGLRVAAAGADLSAKKMRFPLDGNNMWW